MKQRSVLLLLLALAAGPFGSAAAFDHQHGAWNTLLKKHVVWINNGESRVDYSGFQQDARPLEAYLDTLSGVTQEEFKGWSPAQRLAFLINAYNALTVKLILTDYPKLKSIKDLGSVLQSPWKKRFFTLLGQERHLDDIEHGMIRRKGAYDEPRIHVALVCASIGCPALRDEAFVAPRLEAQLEDSLRRFLGDKSRNRYNPTTGALEVSKIFDWYKEDFTSGYRGFDSLPGVFARYAELLADTPEGRRRVRDGTVPIAYLDYDWGLNEVSRSARR